jgi:hypothetical protein
MTLLLLLLAVQGVDPLPSGARPVFFEDWSGGTLDPARWYVLRKKWGAGNHGVVPENVRLEKEDGRNILVCEAHGDLYDGPVTGLWGKRTRVGGVIVSKPFFASGRFEIAMRIGGTERLEGGPADPARPKGSVPAIWTYAYRWVEAGRKPVRDFLPGTPLFNPHMPAYGIGANEYWSELDFPEFGKNGDFERTMYNTFCQNRHEPKFFDVPGAADGRWHIYTTEWRTGLVPLDGVRDGQVVEHEGYHWIRDKAVPFDRYLGNPLKRLGPDRYAVHAGTKARHWIDGRPVGENNRWVPSMAAQLNLGIWLPDWAGPAPWKRSRVSFGPIRVWAYDDPGDVRGVLTEDLKDSFAPDGRELR